MTLELDEREATAVRSALETYVGTWEMLAARSEATETDKQTARRLALTREALLRKLVS